MRKATALLMILSFWSFNAWLGTDVSAATIFSSEAKAKEEAEKKKAEEAEKKATTQREIVKEKREELNGTRWEVKLISEGGTAKDRKDVFTFQDHQLTSQNLSKRGFPSTNYTIRPRGISDVAFFETMQTGEKGVVFIRGEWKEDIMEGTVVENLDEGKTQHRFYFTNAMKEEIAPTEASEEGTEVAVGKQPTVRGALTSGESKKAEDTGKKKPLFGW